MTYGTNSEVRIKIDFHIHIGCTPDVHILKFSKFINLKGTTDPKVITFLYSTQLSMEFKLLIKTTIKRFLLYDFLKLRYIRSKLTHVGHLAVGALPFNSYVNYVTLKHL